MTPFQSTSGTIVQANLKLVFACLLAAIGWLIWPEDLRWYFFYAVSIILYLNATICVGQAIKIFLEVSKQERLLCEIQARGKQAHNAKLLTDEDLKQRGMM